MEITNDTFDGLAEPVLNLILHDCLLAKRVQNALAPATNVNPTSSEEKEQSND